MSSGGMSTLVSSNNANVMLPVIPTPLESDSSGVVDRYRYLKIHNGRQSFVGGQNISRESYSSISSGGRPNSCGYISQSHISASAIKSGSLAASGMESSRSRSTRYVRAATE